VKPTSYLLSWHDIKWLWQDTPKLIPVSCWCTRSSGQPPLHSAAERGKQFSNKSKQTTYQNQGDEDTKVHLPLKSTSNQQASP